MPLLRSFVGGLRALFGKKRAERDLNDELRGYLEASAREKMRSGLTREQALRAARVEMGSLEAVKEEMRSAGWESRLESAWQDLRYAIRRLRRSPGFTLVCILTLALGIGANTAIFTLVDAIMLKPLPVAHPGQLYRLGDNNNCCMMTSETQNGGSWVLYSYPLYRDLRDHTPGFIELAAFGSSLADLSVRRAGSPGPAEPFRGELVTGNYFTMFGVGAFTGRGLTAADDKAGAPPAAVMNYHTWQTRFGGDPSVVGSTFTINTVAYTLVGIASPGFYGDTLRSDPPDFWLPLSTEPLLDRRGGILQSAHLEWLYLIGRLRPGAEPAQVQSQLTLELHQWLWSTGYAEATPEQRAATALVAEARSEIARQHIHLTFAAGGVNRLQEKAAPTLRLLMMLAGIVLLIACSNVATLLLARGTAGSRQTAVRVALGASRGRLVRQMFTESIVTALAGGAAGLWVAYEGTRGILLLAIRGAHYVPIRAQPSPAVLGFALLLSLATGVVFGIAPAWIASHSDPADALRGTGRSAHDRAALAQKPLVVMQVAFSAVLLIGAGLLTESLRNLEDQHFGFETQGRLMVKIDPALSGYTPHKLYGLYQQLEERLANIPGVISVGLSGYSPMEGNNWNEPAFVEGRAGNFQTSWDRVSAHYFETIGTRLLRGRTIEGRDTPNAPHVAVIDETFAREVFPKRDPIGQHLGLGGTAHSGDYEIVGVVEDAKYQNARVPAYPTVFLPLLQLSPSAVKTPNSQEFVSADIGDVELHVAGSPENFEPAVRSALAAIDPNLTVLGMTSFAEQVDLNFNQDRLLARLTELFGALALLLACVGLYGVTAYTVERRTNEIGVRMALGAGQRSVLRLVLRGALAQAGLGVAIGVPAALAAGRLLASELYGVKSSNPVILGGAAAILGACALLAAAIPARRATKVDPMAALRCE